MVLPQLDSTGIRYAYQTVQERIAQAQVNVLSKKGAVQLGDGREKVQQDSKKRVKNSTSCLPPLKI